MSAVVQPQPMAKPPGALSGHPAALNAAAASFAALTARLDYLSPEDVEQVRRAYRFADESPDPEPDALYRDVLAD